MLTKKYLPKKIDYYVFFEVLGPFVGGILFFTFVFLMFQALRLADFFILHGVSGSILLKMTGLMILSFLPTALPIAFLIGILVGFGRLSADSELVAMKAHGISIPRLTAPILFLAIPVVIVSLGLNMEWVPWGDRVFKQLLIRVSNTKVVSSIREGTFTSGFFDLLIYADSVDPKTNRMKHVFIFDEREAKNPLAVIAAEGELLSVKSNTELGASALLRLNSGNIHNNDKSSNSYQKIDFDEYNLFLNIDEGDSEHTLKPRMIPYTVLKNTLKTMAPQTQGYREYSTELWRRYSVAFTPFIFVFMGIGFGTVRTRAVRAGATITATLVITLYWGAQAISTVLGQKGYLPPYLAMQFPNLITGIVACFGYKSSLW